MKNPARQAAFILFSGLATIKYPLFMDTLAERGLRILVIDEVDASTPTLIEAYRQHPAHPYRHIQELALCAWSDSAAILQQVRAWQQQYHLVGLYCLGEAFVQISGLVADLLGFPSAGLRATQVCRNKWLQRLYLSDWSPASTLVEPERRREIVDTFTAFPAVLKPVGRSSSIGVQLIPDRQTLLACLPDYPPDEHLLLEEVVSGREFSIETLVQQGRPFFAGITEKQAKENQGRFFVDVGHTVPATNLSVDEYELLLSVNAQILERLDFQQGISHAEYRLTEQGAVVLTEIAARHAGDSILILYRLATGQALEPVIIDLALNQPASYPPPTRFARQIYFVPPHGYLKDVLVDPALALTPDWVRETGLWPDPFPGEDPQQAVIHTLIVGRKRGEYLTTLKSSADRAVTCLFDAPTVEVLQNIDETLQRAVAILTTEHPEGEREKVLLDSCGPEEQ